MAAVPEERLLTLADYLALPEDNDSEIIRGVLFDVPRPRIAHQYVLSRLAAQLHRYVQRRRGHPLQIIEDADLLMDGRRTYVSPDLMYFPPAAVPVLLEIAGASGRIRVEQARPDLAVEVLSPDSATRDLVEKLREYAAVGVPHYWVLDPREQTFVEFVLRPGEPGAGEYERVLTGLAGRLRGRVRPRLFAGDTPPFTLDLRRLWLSPGG